MMTMLKELVAELIGMFVGDGRLTLAVLSIVAVTGSLIDFVGVDELAGGALLLFGCLILLVESVCRAARAGAP
jgi:hypothetical protein